MKHELDTARRHAENTIAEVNRHFDKGVKNPRHYHMLVDMAEKATRTLHNLDRLDDTGYPYRHTNIGYTTDDLEEMDIVNMPRWRSSRSGRFLPNPYGRRNVQRVRRRADFDDAEHMDNVTPVITHEHDTEPRRTGPDARR